MSSVVWRANDPGDAGGPDQADLGARRGRVARRGRPGESRRGRRLAEGGPGRCRGRGRGHPREGVTRGRTWPSGIRRSGATGSTGTSGRLTRAAEQSTTGSARWARVTSPRPCRRARRPCRAQRLMPHPTSPYTVPSCSVAGPRAIVHRRRAPPLVYAPAGRRPRPAVMFRAGTALASPRVSFSSPRGALRSTRGEIDTPAGALRSTGGGEATRLRGVAKHPREATRLRGVAKHPRGEATRLRGVAEDWRSVEQHLVLLRRRQWNPSEHLRGLRNGPRGIAKSPRGSCTPSGVSLPPRGSDTPMRGFPRDRRSVEQHRALLRR